VGRFKIGILNGQVEVTFEASLQEMLFNFSNVPTPTYQSVNHLLEEYGKRAPDKNWMLKPSFRKRMIEHDKVVRELADLGTRMGFQVHADIEGYKIRDSFPFKVHDQSRVSRIDVVWYTDSRAVAIYEVENTTGISEAIIRGSNVDDANTIRVLVIPEERNSFLKRKIREPILQEQVGRHQCKAISYDDLDDFLNRHKKRPVKLEDMQPLLVNLNDSKVPIQQSIREYFPYAKRD
jgi:hypothetical protein